MKERLVEDWLIRINERGYEIPFSQALAAKGYQVLRSGHSPTEHGKDVVAVAPNGDICGFQLKTGDFAQADVTKHYAQLTMLVEARPLHPGLPANFGYRPVLVTTGEFKAPALSLINELNAGWTHRNLPNLEIVSGRQLHVDFMSLSSDFWPVEAPAIRKFRELYLVDGRGDFDLPQLASFISEILAGVKTGLDLERSAAAANLFTSYLLSEFYNQGDHWSIVQGGTVCAAQIAATGESRVLKRAHWDAAFQLAKGGALAALYLLTNEVLAGDALRVCDRELDDFTRIRNTVAVAAAACAELIGARDSSGHSGSFETGGLIESLINRGRLLFWGEGALPYFLMIIWVLERSGRIVPARSLLLGLVKLISLKNSPASEAPLDDPYTSVEAYLDKMLCLVKAKPTRAVTVESYALLPLIVLAVRRNLRAELGELWRQISHVRFTWFRPEIPADFLLWHCPHGKEHDGEFDRPQSWAELQQFANRDDQERLPVAIREDRAFALLFSLSLPHRILPSLTKLLDSQMGDRLLD